MSVLKFPALAHRRGRATRVLHGRDGRDNASQLKAMALNLQQGCRFEGGGVPMQSSSRKRVSDPDVAPVGLIHLRYIEMFQAILQAGTLTDAACLLNISQPAATKLLKQAERRLGFPLFVRVKGQWHLTPHFRRSARPAAPDIQHRAGREAAVARGEYPDAGERHHP
jgi:Bacterial regulatory helix-turn-helix protein, lysR family